MTDVRAVQTEDTRSTSDMRPRTLWLLICVVAAAVLVIRRSDAEEVAVPIELQVDLMVKVAAYDKRLPARAGDRVRVLILTRAGDPESTRTALLVAKALATKDAIAALPHEETTARFTDGPALAGTIAASRLSVVYFMPGFSDDEIAAAAAALSGVDVLTVAALPRYVPGGVVLGFDVVSGKPKLLVHLGQARRQRVELSADVLTLMRVYP
jgi:hypothetical protein